MTAVDPRDLVKVLGQLGQILDGLWYLETEKRLGFEQAYEIDEAVWKIYSRKEAQRLRSLLGFEQPSLEDIRTILGLSLFNQSLTFETQVVGKDPTRLHFLVHECKTLVGMRRVGRDDEQIGKICLGIGLVFFQALLQELVPGTTVRCLHCPPQESEDGENDPVCAWEFKFPGNLPES